MKRKVLSSEAWKRRLLRGAGKEALASAALDGCGAGGTHHACECTLARAKRLEEALRACLAYIPASEVRSWPPGFELKRRALALASAALGEEG